MLDPKYLGIGMIVGAIPGFFIGARESSTTLTLMGLMFLYIIRLVDIDAIKNRWRCYKHGRKKR